MQSKNAGTPNRASTIISGEAMFNKTGMPGRPEALDSFKKSIDKAIAEAKHHWVDVRTIAELLDGRANSLRVQFATTAPHGQAL